MFSPFVYLWFFLQCTLYTLEKIAQSQKDALPKLETLIIFYKQSFMQVKFGATLEYSILFDDEIAGDTYISFITGALPAPRARYARFAELFRWHPRFPELLYGILIYSPKKHILELYHAYSARRACWLRQIPQNPISERKPLLSLCALRARHVLDSHLAI